jgi:hypothetical protein
MERERLARPFQVLESCKKELRWQLAALPVRIVGRDAQRQELLLLLERPLLKEDENVSVLMVGGRGSGKTLVLRSVLAELRGRYPDRPLSEVYLSGFSFHSQDDRGAVREIARQLHRSAPAAAAAAEADDAAPKSFSESMAQLKQSLEQRGRPIVMVLDEFDQFAARSRQMLLYNLFNVIQSVGTRVAIVGLTAAFDALNHLEKRVKSRFSQRTIKFEPLDSSDQVVEILHDALVLHEGPLAAAAASPTVGAAATEPRPRPPTPPLPARRSPSPRAVGPPKRLVPEGAGKRAVEAVVGRTFSPKQSSDVVRPVRARLRRLGLTPGRGWRRMGRAAAPHRGRRPRTRPRPSGFLAARRLRCAQVVCDGGPASKRLG